MTGPPTDLKMKNSAEKPSERSKNQEHSSLRPLNKGKSLSFLLVPRGHHCLKSRVCNCVFDDVPGH